MEIMAKLDLNGYKTVHPAFDEFQEGIPPTEQVNLVAKFIYQFNLLFVITKTSSQ